MSNHKKYYFYGSMWTVVQLITSGGIIQTFFAEIGFSGKQIAGYTSLINVIQILVMISGFFLADQIRKVKKVSSALLLAPIPLCLSMLPFCFLREWDVSAAYGIALVFCCVQNLFVGFCSVLMMRLLYFIIDMKDYAGLANTNNIISSVFSIVISGMISMLATRYVFRNIMAVGFGISIVFCILCAYMIFSMKEKAEVQENPKKERFSLSELKKLGQKEFRYFYIPNFMRGITAGGMSVIAVVCMKEITTDPAVISGLATILCVATIAGCELYQIVRKRISTAMVYLISSVVMFLFLPLMLNGSRTVIFCVCYFFVGIGYSVINVSGPVYASEIVDYKDIGTYTSVRLIVTMAGQAAASYGVALAMEYVPSLGILLVCGLAQLISGIMYYRYDVKWKQ